MDHHIIAALLENIAEKVVHRLSLRGPVRALPRSPDAATLLPPPGAEAPDPSQEFLATREAAALLGVTVKGLEAMRAKGRGPKFTRVTPRGTDCRDGGHV
jgi:hypothetical protein